MALYLYRCSANHETETHRPMEQRDDTPVCTTCGVETTRVLYPLDVTWKMGAQGLIRSRKNPNNGVGYADPVKDPKTFAVRK